MRFIQSSDIRTILGAEVFDLYYDSMPWPDKSKAIVPFQEK
jgi:hypothetical protein